MVSLVLMAMNPTREYRQEKLTPAQLERAALASPHLYPQDCPCVRCKHRWMQHKGMLCPTKDGYLSSLTGPNGEKIIVPPEFGVDLFIPDENYYREADFDVV